MPNIVQQKRTGNGKQASILSQIVDMGFKDTDGIKLLLYGRSGTGKTTLWGTFPGKILAIVCSGGANPGELRSIDTPENRKRIKQVALRSSMDLTALAEHMASGASGFGTVVIDHLTSLQDLILKEILGLDEIPAQKSWGLASKQQYAQCTLQAKEHLRRFLSLTCNVILIGQERVFGGKEGTDGKPVIEDDEFVIAPMVGAAVSPALHDWLAPACDYVCQTFVRQKTEVKTIKIGDKDMKRREKVKGVEYCLRTMADANYTIKFRVPKREMPECIVDPSYDKIYKLIKG